MTLVTPEHPKEEPRDPRNFWMGPLEKILSQKEKVGAREIIKGLRAHALHDTDSSFIPSPVWPV